MRRRLLLLPLFAAIVFAQAAQRGKPADETNITVDKPRYTYQQTFSAITAVDWKNLAYYSMDEQGRPLQEFRLRNGRYRKQDRLSSTAAELKAVYYLGKPSQYAVVLMDEEDCGANCTLSPTAYLFRLTDDRLTLLQSITAEVHHTAGGGITFDPKPQLLTVRATNYGAGAHCCPEYIDVVTYKWTGSEFEQAERHTIPDPGWRP